MPETVEDLGKLVKSKYGDAYGSMSDIEVGRAVKAKYPEYSQYTDIPDQPSFKAKVQNFLATGNPSGSYNHNPDDPSKQFTLPKWLDNNYVNAGVMAATLGAGALENPEGVVNLAKSLYQGARAGLPKIMGGAAMGAVGSGLEAGVETMFPGLGLPAYARYLATYPGWKTMGQGVKEGAQAFGTEFNPQSPTSFLRSESTDVLPFQAKVAPPEAGPKTPAPKGPSLSMLQDAVKSGHMPVEQFEQELPKLNFDADTQALIKKNLASKIAPKSSYTLGETPKTLSLGHLKAAVKSGIMDMDEFEGSLQKLGYDSESRTLLSQLLKKEMESDAEEAASEGVSKVGKVESPKAKAPETVDVGSTVKSLEGPVPDNESLNIEDNFPEIQRRVRSGDIKPTDKLYSDYENKVKDLQADLRGAKETRLANHLLKTDADLSKIPRTSEYLNALRKESGEKNSISLGTLERAIVKARGLKAKL
jgi:hypothetical protein